MMIDDFVLLSSLPKLNICSRPLPLTSCRPAPLYGIILVCISHACLVVNCDNIPTIGAGAQTPGAWYPDKEQSMSHSPVLPSHLTPTPRRPRPCPPRPERVRIHQVCPSTPSTHARAA